MRVDAFQRGYGCAGLSPHSCYLRTGIADAIGEHEAERRFSMTS